MAVSLVLRLTLTQIEVQQINVFFSDELPKCAALVAGPKLRTDESVCVPTD